MHAFAPYTHRWKGGNVRTSPSNQMGPGRRGRNWIDEKWRWARRRRNRFHFRSLFPVLWPLPHKRKRFVWKMLRYTKEFSLKRNSFVLWKVLFFLPLHFRWAREMKKRKDMRRHFLFFSRNGFFSRIPPLFSGSHCLFGWTASDNRQVSLLSISGHKWPHCSHLCCLFKGEP